MLASLDFLTQDWFWIIAIILWVFYEMTKQAGKVVTGTAKVVASPVSKGIWSIFSK